MGVLLIFGAAEPARARRARGLRLNVPEATAHYLCNDGVILCAFDDPRDEAAAAVFGDLFPDRTVTPVDARTIFAGGGGIHCVTQQQPRI